MCGGFPRCHKDDSNKNMLGSILASPTLGKYPV